MKGDLYADGAGLNAAAHSSLDIADALKSSAVETAYSVGQPSEAGVIALDAALAAMRARQSSRAGGQSAGMDAASAVYTNTDSASAGDITKSI
ncbi:hypothetical protein AFM11_08410 [Mycolicibacterium wolinskyi]|uniref:PE domain-containing protein n=1 Tax=Mycolicibacterium wolinskyi TaxID=59750 RepID=A0A132PQT4_9MYCO|nr:hypothetical protein [Mycolicibacterium wolinskyi]KWX24683.1 hypothetical protein AFM11_08410 [Mycolicibacterium wolinskyi]